MQKNQRSKNQDIEHIVRKVVHEAAWYIHDKLNYLIQIGETQMALIDDLVADVEAQTTVVGSVKALLEQLKAMLDAAGTDPVKLQAVKDTIAKNTTDLSDAVIANTPAAPPEPPVV
jgi:hypothetical protein